MDVRDFIIGDDDEKDQFVSAVMNASMRLTSEMVRMAFKYMDDMPEEMREDMEAVLRSFHGFVGEFVDFAKLEQAIEELELGDEEDGTTA
ncbi:MAG: hypothetical protein VW498_01295 [Candidatus Thalassarchaeaceae archaeon]